MKPQKTKIAFSFFKKLFLMSAIFLAVNILFAQSSVAQGTKKAKVFRAAVVKVDITPADSQQLLGYRARKSIGIHDRIYHRIVALDDGTTQFYLVSTELCVISPSEYDHVAAMVKNQLGIEPVNFLWTLTHTHSAPEVGPAGLGELFLGDRFKHKFDEVYRDMLEQKLVDGIAEARKNLKPAKLGVGWGFAMANINRRAIDVEGKASLGLNPYGPTDRRIGIIRIDNADGTPMTLIANYAIHGTVLGQNNLLISGDAPGVVSEYVQEKTGVPCVFINGAEGNMAPIYTVYDNPRAGHMSEFRVLLGDRILDAYGKISATSPEVTLRSGSIIVETPRKEGMGWTTDLVNYNRTTPSGQHIVKLPVRFLKINEDIAIWSAPLELFCEVSNEIRDRSPFAYTFYFGLGNGWMGYLLNEAEYKYGGYEPAVSPYTPRAAQDLTEGVLNYLQGQMRGAQVNK